MLFVAYLDSIKIDFYRVQGYSNGESFLTPKKKGKLIQNLYKKKKLIWVNPDQCKDKNYYDHSFKTRLRSQLRARPGSYIGLIIDTSQCRDKNGYYYIFKTLLGGRLEAKPGSWVGLVIDPSQNKKKMVIIIILKSNSEINPRLDPGQVLG